MPTRTCKVCGEKVTVASGDLKYLHGATDFLCSPECVVAKIRSFAEQTPVSNIPFKEAEEIDPLGRTAAYSWKLGKNFRSEYEVAVAEFLNTCSLLLDYEKYSFDVEDQTYTPDFYVRSPYNCFIEVKGLFSIGKKTKLTKFIEQYPDVNFILVPWTLRSDFIERTNSDREEW